MRIVGGAARGRSLKVARGADVRPTSGRVREALFSLVASRVSIADAAVLDLFSGSGALALEALSRGASRAVAVDSDRRCCRVIADNATALGLAGQLDVMGMTAERAVVELARRGASFALITLDAPYRSGLSQPALAAIAKAGILSEGGLIVVEHENDEDALVVPAALTLLVQKHYGETALTIVGLAEAAK